VELDPGSGVPPGKNWEGGGVNPNDARRVWEEFLERYGPVAGEDGPLLFVVDVLGVTPEKWQRDMLRAFGRGERKISIRSGNGTGKTAFVSWCILYMLLFRYPQNTVATAPSKQQLEDALVVRVLEWFGRLPQPIKDRYEVKKNRIELLEAPATSWFSARTAREEQPEALKGVHSDHVLLVVDEASGVPEAIFAAGKGSMSSTNAQTILISNPHRTSGYFYKTHNQSKHNWLTLHVKPGESSRVDPTFRQEIIDDWGEDSDEYRVMWLGEFPRQDLNTLIPREHVESARKRDVIVPDGVREIWGLDVARFGDDANALVRRSRLAVSPQIERWAGKDLMETAGRVKARWDETPPHLRPEEILVDEIGLGAGVVDRLMELKLPVRGINVAEASSTADKYRNLRTELWFRARDWLASKNHKLPSCDGGCGRECLHEVLADELLHPRYGYTSTGKMLVEPKDSMKKRGIRSPNVADAFVLTFASEPTTLFHGSGNDRSWSSSWNEPIKRNLSVV
jgi:phage terminase large subunit